MATYLILNLLFIGAVLLMFQIKPHWLAKNTWLLLAIVLILTAIFDSLIVAFSIVDYAPEKILGWYVGRAPVEDFAYAILAVIIMPVLWRLSATITRQTWKQLFWVSRPISWVNTAFPFAAGYLVAGGSLNPLFFVATLFFLIPYNLLMYGVNDIFDYESDILNPRKGGIEGMREERAFHPVIARATWIAVVPFVAIMFALGSLQSALTLIGVLFFVVAYSIKHLRFKEVPLLDSVTSSLHFVGPLIFALSLTGFPTDAWWYVAAFFIWGVASHAFGAVQDIVPDRAGQISSIATVLGARSTVVMATGAYVIAAIIIGLADFRLFAVALCGIGYALNTARFRHITDASSGKTNAGWKVFLKLNYITGFVLTVTLILINF